MCTQGHSDLLLNTGLHLFFQMFHSCFFNLKHVIHLHLFILAMKDNMCDLILADQLVS